MSSAEDALRQARQLAQVGRYEQAERAVRAGLAGSPGHGRLLTLLAWVLRMRRQYASALAAADTAVEAAPGSADAHAERAEILILLIRSRDAVAAAEEAVRLAPLEPAGHFVLARALSVARDSGRARAVAAHGLSLRPGSVEGLLTVAEVERLAGNRAEASAAARAALAVDPANPYGRWLIAMLDAERLRVRRSMRGLSAVAREDPARPDLLSMTWPIRGVLGGLRRGLAAGATLICLLLVAGHWWRPAEMLAQVLSAVLALVLTGFAARVLIPAGRLPWRCLALLPPLMRRADIAAVVTMVAAVALLTAHAVTAGRLLAVAALAMVPVLWALGLAETLGAGLDDPGFRHALAGLRAEFRDWWQTTKRDLREAWSDKPKPGGK